MSAPPFLPGAELSRRFYEEIVRPLLDKHSPDLPHSAGLLDTGSDVLGYDTPMSRDHDWGPRVQIFLREEDAGLATEIDEICRFHLPLTFYGYGTGMEETEEAGVYRVAAAPSYPLRHRVSATTWSAFMRQHLGFDIAQPLTAIDWLSFPSQQLLTLTTGPVFHDALGEVTQWRQILYWYPHDVWLYLLASAWQRIGQEEHLMPRAGHAGDELGSAIIGSRLVRDVMSLCFLQERHYAPYPKWFGTAFSRLACAATLTPILWQAQRAETWHERGDALAQAYEIVAARHNDLRIAPQIATRTESFFGRPFKVIWGESVARTILAQITDPAIVELSSHRLIGSIDQWSDSTDIRSDMSLRQNVLALYQDRSDRR